jgi:hypothetical protein
VSKLPTCPLQWEPLAIICHNYRTPTT